MSHSNTQIYLHLVFSTKNRRHSITGEIEKKLYSFFWNKITELGSTPIIMNGIADHVHLLFKFDGKIPVPKLAQHIKGASSKFINDTFEVPTGFSWQRGYGVFSVSPKDVDMIHNYIKKQKEHHSNNAENNEHEWFEE